MDQHGISDCLRYAFPPNSLHYCGPERQADIKGYLETHTNDKGLGGILSQFETLYPYLKLIAGANHIKDPFDRRVVEAYWIGNGLLSKVPKQEFHTHLNDSLKVQKKLSKNKILTMDNLMTFGLPHHTFHVLTIYVRTGNHAIAHTLHTMDSCRIGWGKVVMIDTRSNSYTISMPHLEYSDDRLTLGKPTRTIVRSVENTFTVGDIVSVHWGYICGTLTLRQVNNLVAYTKDAISSASRLHILV